MAVFRISYFSNELNKDCQMNVILPQSTADTPFSKEELEDIPVIYLLHGMGGNHDSWLSYTNIERLLKQTAVAVVLPNADLSWYSETNYGLNYYAALINDLPMIVSEFFPQISTKREKTFVVGLSMGGFGAYKVGFSSEKFSYVASLSGAFDISGSNKILKSFAKEQYWNGILDEQIDYTTSENNLLYLAKRKLNNKEAMPRFYAWCGEQDFLFEDNEKMIADLNQLGIAVTYSKSSGKHDWYYWDKQIEDVLEWLPIHYVKEERLEEIEHG